MVDLKAFVAEAICQIVEGVSEAQDRVKEKGGVVNPSIAAHHTPKLTEHGLFFDWRRGRTVSAV